MACLAGAPGRTRTCYLGIRNPALYPHELRGREDQLYAYQRPSPVGTTKPHALN